MTRISRVTVARGRVLDMRFLSSGRNLKKNVFSVEIVLGLFLFCFFIKVFFLFFFFFFFFI